MEKGGHYFRFMVGIISGSVVCIDTFESSKQNAASLLLHIGTIRACVARGRQHREVIRLKTLWTCAPGVGPRSCVLQGGFEVDHITHDDDLMSSPPLPPPPTHTHSRPTAVYP